MQNINFEDIPLTDEFDFEHEEIEYHAKWNGIEYEVTGGGLSKGFGPARYKRDEVKRHLKSEDWEIIKPYYEWEDSINKPSHYHKNEIDVNGYLEKHFPLEGSYTVAEGFYIGNVIKYTSRYKDKGGKQDLEKAKFNLNKLIELEESK